VRVLIAGELNVDLILRNYSAFPAPGREVLVQDVALTLGSASAICASALAKLGEQVTFMGKVGQDSWGDLCVNALAQADVDCSRVSRDPALKTGITVSISSAKDRALVTYLGSIEALRAAEVSDDVLAGFDHLHVSSFFLQRGLRPGLKDLLARAHSQGLSTSLDPGFDPEYRWERDLIDTLSETDVFLPNEVELVALTDKQDWTEALHALDNGRTLIVAKLGAHGCIAIQNGSITSVSAFPVKPVDTTGAGDTFNAGFLHAWFGGASIEEALQFGAACGALSTLADGGTGNQPTSEEAREFMLRCMHAESETN